MVRIAIVTLVAFVGATSVQAAGFDCTKFARNDDDSWRVVQALEIRGPRGRIDFTPDEVYTEGHEKMGLDLAKLLNANCVKK
jgi:hypothetical protein